MTENLADGWHSPEDRKIMVRALERFSAECETPNLTPECPFYELDGSGDAQCAEQCQDLIARYPEDKAPDQLLRLGEGIAAERRRPRRGPGADEAAFDAGKAAIEDASKPLAERGFGSLLTMVRDRTYSQGGGQDVEVSDEDLVAEIERRGINTAATLPIALAHDRAMAVQVGLIINEIDSDGGPDTGPIALQISERLAEWQRVLDEFGSFSHVGPPGLVTAETRKAMTTWLSGLDVASLFEDLVPTIDELRAAARLDFDQDLHEEGRWMLDRFTQTYVDQWSSASRVREWRFINAQRPGCCPPGLMRQRKVDPAALATALADEHCTRQEDDADPKQSWTPNHFKTMAIARLTSGRPEAAANVYRVVADLDPDDAEIRNNLGFCLIASEPKEAISHLRTSLELGSPTPTLTQFNLGLALHLAGLAAEARQVTLTAMAEHLGPDETAYVWAVGDGVLDFVHVESLLDYGEALVQHMSECAGQCVYEDLLLLEGDEDGPSLN